MSSAPDGLIHGLHAPVAIGFDRADASSRYRKDDFLATEKKVLSWGDCYRIWKVIKCLVAGERRCTENQTTVCRASSPSDHKANLKK